MSRNSWIIFGMIAIVIISILLVALLILVPQAEPAANGISKQYEQITQSEYSYTQSKDISDDSMKETYTVTPEDIKEGAASKLYKSGNVNPFEDQTQTEISTASSNGTSGSASSGQTSNANGNTAANTSTNAGTNASTGTNTNTGNAANEPTYTVDDK